MVIWINAASINAETDQRASILMINDECVITAQLLGTGDEVNVTWKDVRGVELEGKMSLFFKPRHMRMVKDGD